MSWVAEKKAISQKQTSVVAKNPGNGSSSPTAAIAKAIRYSIPTVHQRFVRNRSTNGLQNGLITHGR